MNKKILIAKIISVFGIKGEVKIVIYSNNIANIKKYQLFDDKNNEIKIKITSKKDSFKTTRDGHVVVNAKIENIESRNDAEKIIGKEIFTTRDNFSKTKKNEFYYVDLIGLDVVDENSKIIGKVVDVFDYGAGGVVEIEFNHQNKKILENFPFKDEIFPEVNIEKNIIKFVNGIK